MKGKAIIVSAPSGAGKTTIVKHLLEGGLRLEFSVSATTRNPRGDEKDGVDYFFLGVDEFRRRVSEGLFVEWEEVYSGIMYGTLRSEVERIWNKGNHLIFDVDVRGGVSLKNIFGIRSISIFIMPPSVEELENRLVKRGTDTSETIGMRVEKARDEMKLANQFDTIIVNHQLDRAKKETILTVRSFLENIPI